jgi:cell division protein ZapA
MKSVVKILNKEFQVQCPSGSEEQLLEAAHYLDKQIRLIRASGRVIGLERMAMMAALNISYDLLQLRQQQALEHQTLTHRIQHLQNKIDGILLTDEAPLTHEL